MTSLLPVAVTKMSALGNASSMVATAKPSIAAWSAQIGSISVTMTRAPAPLSDWAEPLPTSPWPQPTATMHAGRRLFRDALDRGLDPGEPAGTCRETLLDLGEKAFLFFILRVGDERGILLCLGAQENEQSGIAAIIKDHIAGLARPVEDA